MTAERSESVIRRDRFSGGPARSFLSSMSFDRRIFAADLAVDRAHVVMLTECDVIEDVEAGQILAALDTVESAGFDALPDAEDVHEAIETAVIEEVGAVGGKMHTARSRNDEIATCLRYRLREDVLELLETSIACRTALAELAHEHADTVMPGYTHLQPAQPTTLGHWALSYESALARDTERLFEAFDRLNRSPLGAAAFAGTPYEVDRDRTAALLGFDGVLENATDAVSSRDFLVEVSAAVTALSLTLSSLAADVIHYANRGYVELADDYASTSSIMPQKINPDSLELTRATAGDATAGLNGLVTTLKGLPRAYNRDLQQASPHAWAGLEPVTEATAVATGALTTASWDEAALAVAAGVGFTTATGVADLLAQAGVPFRTAHEIVATAATDLSDDPDTKAVIEAVESTAREVLGPDGVSPYVEAAELAAVLDPIESVATRDSFGGPAPMAVAAALDRVEADLTTDTEQLTDRRETLAAAAAARREEVDRYG